MVSSLLTTFQIAPVTVASTAPIVDNIYLVIAVGMTLLVGYTIIKRFKKAKV